MLKYLIISYLSFTHLCLIYATGAATASATSGMFDMLIKIKMPVKLSELALERSVTQS